jgi:hypothetical protein
MRSTSSSKTRTLSHSLADSRAEAEKPAVCGPPGLRESTVESKYSTHDS